MIKTYTDIEVYYGFSDGNNQGKWETMSVRVETGSSMRKAKRTAIDRIKSTLQSLGHDHIAFIGIYHIDRSSFAQLWRDDGGDGG